MKKLRLFTLLLISGFVFSLIFAQQEDIKKRLAECAAIKDDIKRLECYDRLVRELGLIKTSSIIPTKGTGKWVTRIDKNPLDDTKTVFIALTADEGKSRWGDNIILVIRCMSNKTELYINWNDYLGSESASVTTRVGEETAQTKSWSLSTDSKASFYPGNPIPFIRSLMKADRLVARVVPYGENPVIAVFDIRGLSEAIKPIQETCGWK